VFVAGVLPPIAEAIQYMSPPVISMFTVAYFHPAEVPFATVAFAIRSSGSSFPES